MARLLLEAAVLPERGVTLGWGSAGLFLVTGLAPRDATFGLRVLLLFSVDSLRASVFSASPALCFFLWREMLLSDTSEGREEDVPTIAVTGGCWEQFLRLLSKV